MVILNKWLNWRICFILSFRLHELYIFHFPQFVLIACLIFFLTNAWPLVAQFFSISLFLYVNVIIFFLFLAHLSFFWPVSPSILSAFVYLSNFLVSSPWFPCSCSRCISPTTLDFNYIFFHVLPILPSSFSTFAAVTRTLLDKDVKICEISIDLN